MELIFGTARRLQKLSYVKHKADERSLQLTHKFLLFLLAELWRQHLFTSRLQCVANLLHCTAAFFGLVGLFLHQFSSEIFFSRRIYILIGKKMFFCLITLTFFCTFFSFLISWRMNRDYHRIIMRLYRRSSKNFLRKAQETFSETTILKLLAHVHRIQIVPSICNK